MLRRPAGEPGARQQTHLERTLADDALGVDLELPVAHRVVEQQGAFRAEGGEADLAVHSLKDLPTTLPAGLKLGAVSKRADVRDVLIYRDAAFLATEPKHEWAGASEPRVQCSLAVVLPCRTRLE